MKTFKYRLFPTKAQRTILNQTLDMCRWVFNKTLETRKNVWEQKQKSLSLFETNKLLTGWKMDKPELKSVHSQVLQNVQERVDLAFKRSSVVLRRVKSLGIRASRVLDDTTASPLNKAASAWAKNCSSPK